MNYKNEACEEQVASYDMSNVSIITFNELLNMLRLEMLCWETQDNALRQDKTMVEVANQMSLSTCKKPKNDIQNAGGAAPPPARSPR